MMMNNTKPEFADLFMCKMNEINEDDVILSEEEEELDDSMVSKSKQPIAMKHILDSDDTRILIEQYQKMELSMIEESLYDSREIDCDCVNCDRDKCDSGRESKPNTEEE